MTQLQPKRKQQNIHNQVKPSRADLQPASLWSRKWPHLCLGVLWCPGDCKNPIGPPPRSKNGPKWGCTQKPDKK